MFFWIYKFVCTYMPPVDLSIYPPIYLSIYLVVPTFENSNLEGIAELDYILQFPFVHLFHPSIDGFVFRMNNQHLVIIEIQLIY